TREGRQLGRCRSVAGIRKNGLCRTVYNVLNEWGRGIGTSKRSRRIGVELLEDHSAHESRYRNGRRRLQFVANPLDLARGSAGGILRVWIRLDDQIKIARGGACSAAERSNHTGIIAGVARTPGKRRDRKKIEIGADIAGRGIAGIVDVAHDLVQAETRFLERGKHLRFGLIAVLG